MADDAFWAEVRAREEAQRGRHADPSACGTCLHRVANGEPVEHDECAKRATFTAPPDMPSHEVLIDMTEQEKKDLPARFHLPHFDDCGKPNAWLCTVCWGEGWVSAWPCATAAQHGKAIFTPEHAAEAEQVRADAQKAEYDRLLRRVAGLEGEIGALREENRDLERALGLNEAA